MALHPKFYVQKIMTIYKIKPKFKKAKKDFYFFFTNVTYFHVALLVLHFVSGRARCYLKHITKLTM